MPHDRLDCARGGDHRLRDCDRADSPGATSAQQCLLAAAGYAGLYSRLVRHRPADWVMVLGSGLRAGREVPPLLASRVSAGLAEFARRRARILIMSGGQGRDELIPEVEAMARWAIDNGANPAVLRTEIESRNTEQNLRFTSTLVRAEPAAPDLGPGLIVTSNYHVLRAAMLALLTSGLSGIQRS